jgi:hypothetical protein
LNHCLPWMEMDRRNEPASRSNWILWAPPRTVAVPVVVDAGVQLAAEVASL